VKDLHALFLEDYMLVRLQRKALDDSALLGGAHEKHARDDEDDDDPSEKPTRHPRVRMVLIGLFARRASRLRRL